MAIIKRPFRIKTVDGYDMHYFETSSDMVKMATTIAGLTGDNVQAILQALKNYVDTKTSWVSSTAETGYIKFPFGAILQWGRVMVPRTPNVVNINFPIAFPSVCHVLIPVAYTAGAYSGSIIQANLSRTNVTYTQDFFSGDVMCMWFAVGV